jgi:hypothetical protein
MHFQLVSAHQGLGCHGVTLTLFVELHVPEHFGTHEEGFYFHFTAYLVAFKFIKDRKSLMMLSEFESTSSTHETKVCSHIFGMG